MRTAITKEITMNKTAKIIMSTTLMASMAFSAFGCSTAETTTADTTATETTADVAETTEAAAETTEASETAADLLEGKTVMTYAEYAAAPVDSEVTVETYIQAKQGWWENEGVGNASFYTQDENGAYFLYNMPCTEDEYAKLTVGTKIKVNGFKSEWSGEVEITDAKFVIEEGNYVATATDVTDKLASDELISYQNLFVSFTDMTVEASNDAGAAFLYSYDGSGSQGDDLYFKVSVNGQTYTFTVESYLTGADTEVYKAVEGLKVGDKVDMEGFLYWYEGAQTHVTNVTVG